MEQVGDDREAPYPPGATAWCGTGAGGMGAGHCGHSEVGDDVLQKTP